LAHLLKQRQAMAKRENETRAKTLECYIDYLKGGGKITAKIPNATDVEEEIEKGRPLLALLTSNFLSDIVQFNFHFNVITGITGENVYINDPVWHDY
jgi:hypothetical protein